MNIRLTTIIVGFLSISLVWLFLLVPTTSASERVYLSQLGISTTPITTPTITSSVTPAPTQRPTYNSLFCRFLNFSQCKRTTPTSAQVSTDESVETGNNTDTTQVTTGNTTLHVTLLLHGIGNAGDQKNPTAQGNPNPKTTTQTVNMTIFDENNSETAQASGTVTFSSTSGAFEGDIQTELAPGNYTAILDLAHYPQEPTKGIINVAQNASTVTLDPLEFVTGDINDDETVNILDYNILQQCIISPETCTEPSSDLDSSGVMDLFDYNLFIRELSNYRSSTQ